MNNDCLLLGDELAFFVTDIAKLKSLEPSNEPFSKVVLEEDDVSRKVSYVTFCESYERKALSKHKTFYVIEGSGCFTLNGDCIRYTAGDILMAIPNTSWKLESDKAGTEIIEVCSKIREKEKPKESESQPLMWQIR